MHKVIKDYVCFDLETTGFGKTAEIIEIGAIKVRDGTTVDKFRNITERGGGRSEHLGSSSGLP